MAATKKTEIEQLNEKIQAEREIRAKQCYNDIQQILAKKNCYLVPVYTVTAGKVEHTVKIMAK